ncbi:MAG: aminopeptidase P family protein [Bacillaceae bacterium]|nr:aminopeptidase P family protein [Bacillaceae bacterium]
MNKHRIEALRQALNEKNLDGIIITSSYNRRYITGFTGTAGYVVITEDSADFITDFRYVDQAEKQAPLFNIVRHTGPILDTVKEVLNQRGIKRLAFEKEHVTFSLYESMKEKLDGVELVPESGMVEKIRAIKDEQEIRIMEEAASIADEAFSHILSHIKPGVTEKEIALELEFFMRKKGADSSSFDMIVASGYRSALPHGVASDKVIEKGELVTLDFGAYYKGYCSDITRTVAVGEPDDKLKEIYEIVRRAQLNGVEHVKAGMTGIEADALTRDIIKEAGYGDYFGHSTGHGLGMEVHEAPGLSPRVDTILQPGMVVTIEPGIYISGLGGVRIEDDVVITEKGCTILTKSKKDLIIL